MRQPIDGIMKGMNSIGDIVRRAVPRSGKVMGVGLAAVVIVSVVLPAMAEATQKLEEVSQKRVDLYGDPLPAGAVARLGTRRFRHQRRTESVAFSPDGKLIASVGGDKAVIVSETATGKIRHRLLGHTHSVYTMAFSRDGGMLASGTRMGGQVILWDVVKGSQVRELPLQGSVSSVAFSPDGKVVVTTSDRGIWFWDVASGLEKDSIIEEDAYWAEYLPDGKRLVSVSRRGKETSRVRVWDIAAGMELRRFEWGGMRSAALSPDGKALAAGKKDGPIRVWDVESGELIVEFPFSGRGSRWNADIVFSADGKVLASVGDSRNSRAIRVLGVKTGKDVVSCKGHLNGALSLAFSPDGKILASGGWYGRVCLWDVESGDEVAKAPSHFGAVRSVAFLPDGRSVVTKSTDATIRLWDAAACVQRQVVSGNWGSAVSPEGRLMASAGNNGTIRVVDLEGGQHLHTLIGHGRFVERFAFTADSKRLASGDRARELRVWDVNSGDEIIVFDSKVDGVIVFSPDGKILASGGKVGALSIGPEGELQGKNTPICLWDAASGKELARFGTGEDPVSSVAFSADGRFLVSGHGVLGGVGGGGRGGPVISSESSNTVRVWNVETGKPVSSLKGHTEAVSSVAFSPDGTVVASCSMDGSIRLWEVSSGKEIVKLEGHGLPGLEGVEDDAVHSVTFSPDGKIVASGSEDGTVLFWDVEEVTKPKFGGTGEEGVKESGRGAEAGGTVGPTVESTGFRVIGRVLTDPDGEGVEGAVVSLVGGGGLEGGRIARTDKAGVYSFGNVKASERPYFVGVAVRPAGEGAGGVLASVSGGDVRVEDLYMAQPQSVSGTVLDVDTSEPIGGVRISFRDAAGRSGVVSTDPRGRYKLYVPAGQVTVECKGTQERYFPVESGAGKLVVVGLDANAAGTDFKVRSAPKFVGLVTLPEGKAAEGVDVEVLFEWQRNGRRSSMAIDGAPYVGLKTDAEGRFEGYLRCVNQNDPSEKPNLRIAALTADRSMGCATVVEAASEVGLLEPIKLTLRKAGNAMIGFVDGKGDGIDKVDVKVLRVRYVRRRTGMSYGRWPDESVTSKYVGKGRYELSGLIPGRKYSFAFSARGYKCKAVSDKLMGESFVFGPGQTVDLGEFKLEQLEVKSAE